MNERRLMFEKILVGVKEHLRLDLARVFCVEEHKIDRLWEREIENLLRGRLKSYNRIDMAALKLNYQKREFISDRTKMALAFS
ncbi:hypothetical protein CEXT_686201 [Caerostris extrusa]|uniref:Uncharacterized protein n=1 Tax=Caerostris extrusa TaxID=172846 RepID=A0AAV4YBQ1_CAEEX|nr:hypothetical protein CEXT_686201 [Caerostris extrusa]